MRKYSPDDVRIANTIKERYSDLDIDLLISIVSDVRDLHMKSFLKHRSTELRQRGYERGD